MTRTTEMPSGPVLRGITVRPPWAVPIMAPDGAGPAPKRCENRVWYLVNLPTHLVIHAGKRVEDDAFAILADLGFPVEPDRCVRGAFLGVVSLLNIHAPGQADCRCGAWVARDQYHFALADPRPFSEPIPGPGGRRIFHLPEHVRDVALSELARPRAVLAMPPGNHRSPALLTGVTR